MSHIRIERTIDLPSSPLWDAMKHFGEIEKFHPQVKRSQLLSREASGAGAERRCDFHDGNWVKERVLQWEEGRSMRLSIYDGTMPVHSGEAVITLNPLSSAKTLATFELSYTPKMGPLGKVMDALMMRSQFTKILTSILAGLETHARTGAVVGPDGQPESTAALAA